MVFSNFRLYVLQLYAIFQCIAFLLFPYGDEPDFEERLRRLNEDEFPAFAPYRYINFFGSAPLDHECIVNASFMSIDSYISLDCLSLNLRFFWAQASHTFLCVLPLVVVLIYYSKSRSNTFKHQKVHWYGSDDYSRRADAVSLSLLIPGMAYNLNFMSQEVFVLSISLFIYLTINSLICTVAIAFLVYSLDDGNFLVVSLFILIYQVTYRSQLYMSHKYLLTTMLILLIAAGTQGGAALALLLEWTQSTKLGEVKAAIDIGDLYSKYPIVLRPLLAFGSMVFITSNGVKSVVAFSVLMLLILSFVVSISTSRLRTSRFLHVQSENYLRDRSLAYCSVLTVGLISLMVPSHAYGKYFVFLAPFLIGWLLWFVERRRVLISLVALNILVYIDLLQIYSKSL